MKNPFIPTHEIRNAHLHAIPVIGVEIDRDNGTGERVWALYTAAEWDAYDNSDWTYHEDSGLKFQGSTSHHKCDGAEIVELSVASIPAVEVSRRTGKMNVNQMLNELDRATVDGNNAADKRRILAAEANTLRAAVQSGDKARIGAALAEAGRVLDMWRAY